MTSDSLLNDDADDKPVDLMAEFRTAVDGLIDRPIWIRRKRGPALALRLIALRKSEATAAEARRKARRQARKEGYQLSQRGLAAADWLIEVTSLHADTFPTDDVLALYRLRWRVELAFKRLKSLVGLKGPPGRHECSAKPYVLAHLLMILLLEPLIAKLVGHLRRGPSGPYLDGFATTLERQGYSADTAVRYLRAMARQGVLPSDIVIWRCSASTCALVDVRARWEGVATTTPFSAPGFFANTLSESACASTAEHQIPPSSFTLVTRRN
jgi:hypothetical protein